MSEDRYQALQDAITKARREAYDDGQHERNAHLDTLQAILAWHVVAVDGNCGSCCHYRWPCPDVLTVETALRNMGATNDPQ